MTKHRLDKDQKLVQLDLDAPAGTYVVDAWADRIAPPTYIAAKIGTGSEIKLRMVRRAANNAARWALLWSRDRSKTKEARDGMRHLTERLTQVESRARLGTILKENIATVRKVTDLTDEIESFLGITAGRAEALAKQLSEIQEDLAEAFDNYPKKESDPATNSFLTAIAGQFEFMFDREPTLGSTSVFVTFSADCWRSVGFPDVADDPLEDRLNERAKPILSKQ